MSNSDSDSDSDADYIPEEAVASEDSDSGADEGELKNVKTQESFKRTRKGGIRVEEADSVQEEEEEEPLVADGAQEKELAKQKQKADSLWANFMSDVGSRPSKPTEPKDVKTKTNGTSVEASKSDLVKVTKVFDFAGEEIKVTKEVSAHSKEAQSLSCALDKSDFTSQGATAAGRGMLSTPGVKRRGGGGGLSSVLDKLGKKPKMSVLDKSKMDWDQYKDKEGISDELALHNRGKEGYIERQQFLQRADLRQFEIEKSMRQSSSRR